MAAQRDISPVFVEGLDISAYGITRSVGRHGVPVYALNDKLRDPLRYSKYVRECFVYPDDPTQPRAYAGDSVANEDVLCKLILEWGARFAQKPVLFATSDWFARFLSSRQQELKDRFLFHWVEPQLFNTIVDKGSMVRFCERVGVKVPHTHITRPEDDIAQVARGFVYPCLIKPIHRYTVGFPVESAKVLIAQTAQEAQDFFAKYPQMKGATLMQELIEGGDDQVFQYTALVNTQGEIAAYSTVRKLRQYPAGYGSMCYGVTEYNEALALAGRDLILALGYRGLGSIEFKHRQKDGGYYFIEMNTRLPWYNGIFADAGVNLPHLAYLDLASGLFEHNAAGFAPPQQHDRTTWVGYHNYASWFRDTRAGRTGAGRTESGETMLRGRMSFFYNVARAKSYGWWNPSDPKPFLASGFLAARRLAGKLLRKIGLR
jgi:predicted ATP-grasp superfamily ATP-dependent carboligase